MLGYPSSHSCAWLPQLSLIEEATQVLGLPYLSDRLDYPGAWLPQLSLVCLVTPALAHVFGYPSSHSYTRIHRCLVTPALTAWGDYPGAWVTRALSEWLDYPGALVTLALSEWLDYPQSQPKVSGHPQTKALPRFPSFNVATMMSTFLSIFFWTCKTTLGWGYGGKGSHCPMLLSEIVWKSYVRYVVSFYVMLISTLLQSHVRARPVQRWRCTILNKIITAATAVKLHGNRCSLNHVDMNL